MITAKSPNPYRSIYRSLLKTFGPQHWWPGDTPLEVMVGAVLTQNTNWGNVEKAIRNLKAAGVLTLDKLYLLPLKTLARHIKPSGYFNVKARRLKALIACVVEDYGSIARMSRESTEILRDRLLATHGIGPETADSILLYAFDRPVFVVDAYTKRIFSRYGLVKAHIGYHPLQEAVTQHVKSDVRMFNEYHALLVRLGKEFCRPKPLCAACPLGPNCHRRI